MANKMEKNKRKLYRRKKEEEEKKLSVGSEIFCTKTFVVVIGEKGKGGKENECLA